MNGYSDPCGREAAWLNIADDSLPALLSAAGGPFDVVQADWPGAAFARMKTGVYVLLKRNPMPRFGGQRIMPGYSFWLKICWPVRGSGGMAPLGEGEQAALRAAVNLLLQRVDGLPGDKTHGGRFLSVGESVVPAGGHPEVTYADPEATIPQGWLRADMTYLADDFEFQG